VKQLELLTVKEVAQSLRLSTIGVYGLINAGRISHLRVGANEGAIRIPRAALEAYFAKSQVEAQEG